MSVHLSPVERASDGVVWWPTMRLRIVEPDYCFAKLEGFNQLRIQQLWLSDDDHEWRDVPHVTEREAAK